MSIFNLPDLGEGLPDAEIHEWYVKEGDTVSADQPLVAMETAKAVVDVPCPHAGKIKTLHGKPGDLIKTGEALVEYESSEPARTDKGTVVGSLEESTTLSREDNFIIGGSASTAPKRAKATPAVRLLAKKLNIDINAVTGSGEHGLITQADVQMFAKNNTEIPEDYVPLRGTRRSMLSSMKKAHEEVVSVSIFDEVNLASWSKDSDLTVRLIQAIVEASQKEPALNAWFDGEKNACKYFEDVHIGLAMDNKDGLFVPVIHQANQKNAEELRRNIEQLKTEVTNRTVTADNLKGATISLSNFGKFAGRFANPIIVPPTVAILAVGRLYEGVVVQEGQVIQQAILPLSLSFDHRAITGGEATRFLGAVMDALKKAG